MLECAGVEKRFGAEVALAGVGFAAARGELVGLLGPNGAGKTTLMRLITGFLPRDAGSVRVGGVDPDDDPVAVKRLIGYLPESAPLHPEMSVEEYLGFRARVKDVAGKQIGARIASVLDQVGIGDARRRLIGQLSKGYRQRVGLADALIADPPLLVLDEPTSGLDPAQIRTALALVRDLAGERTILYSSHVLPEVEAVASRVIVLARGRIVADVAPGPAAGTFLRVAAEDEDAAAAALPDAEREGQGRIRTGMGADEAARAVVGAGCRLLELRPRSLEEIYLAATGREP